MPKSKRLGLALAVLIAAAIAAWVFVARIGPSMKSAIETQGALATQTQVLVGGIEFSPFTGAGALDGLSVNNPAGSSSPYAVLVHRIVLQAESSSLLGDGPVIIDSATVIAPQITYEAKGPTAVSNLETIKNNAQAYAASPAATRTKGSARKVIIRDLTIMGGSITLNTPLPGGALSVPLPPIHLTNIGADTNGATPSEVIRLVCQAIADEAKKAVGAAIAQKVESVLGAFRPPAEILKSLPKPPKPPPLPQLPKGPPPLPKAPEAPEPPPKLSAPDFPSPPGTRSQSRDSEGRDSQARDKPPKPPRPGRLAPPPPFGMLPPPPGY